ncbi:MAG: response regulator [Eubacterium sp.]|nr:response regulator [Eubacterium sp.]
MSREIDLSRLPVEQSGEIVPGGFIIYRAAEGEEIIHCNKRVAEIFGCEDQEELLEYLHHSFKNVVHPEDYERVKSTITHNLKEDETYRDYMEYRIIRKDGEVRQVIDNGKLFEDETHGPVFTVYLNDITDIKQEPQLDDERSHIISAITKLFYVSYYIDLVQDTFIELSVAGVPVEAVTGTSGVASETLNKTCETNVVSKYREEMLEFVDLTTLNERMGDKVCITHEFEGIYAGWVRAIFVAGKRDKDGNLTHVVWTMKIINDEKEIEFENARKLQMAYDKAEKASNAKGTFLLNMSHDIRTPINAIVGYANLLETHMDDPAVMKKYIEYIQYSGETLLELIENVLQMAKIETGHIKLYEEPVDIRDIGKKIGIIFEREYKKKNLKIVRDINPVHPIVYMDVSKTEQIILNVLSNAIKYSQNGGTIMLSVNEWNCEKPGYSYYKTVFRDNGIGMSKDYQTRLFDTFTRERSYTETKIPGTGLGIGITKKLVELMNGNIYVESEEGKGTRVEVILPLRRVEPEEVKRMQEARREDVNLDLLKGKRILVAEDNELNREIAVEILEQEGMIVEAVEDGVECVARIEKQPPDTYDMILMDIQMPNMDGYRATQRIRALDNPAKATIPIIALTANVFGEENIKAQEIGMNGFAIKPIDKQALFTTMVNALK